MVGMNLDAALLCEVANSSPMALQVSKKVIYETRNSGKDRIQELEEAKVGIDIMIQFEKLMQASRKNPMYDDTSKACESLRDKTCHEILSDSSDEIEECIKGAKLYANTET